MIDAQREPTNIEFVTKQSAGFLFVQLFVAQLLFLAVVALFIVLMNQTLPSVAPYFGIGQISALLIVLELIIYFGFFLVTFFRWQKTEYRLFGRQLKMQHGVIATSTDVIDLSTIDQCKAHQNTVGKLFGYGTIDVYLHTADQPITLIGIQFPQQFLRRLEQLMSVSQPG